MSKFEVIETFIKDLVIVNPAIFSDERGFFLETYNKKEFFNQGLKMDFIQDNHSKSKKSVLRGLHFQTKFSQGKLVRVTRGAVWDVAVDLRKSSLTYGKWYGIELNDRNKTMFYIPEGFAHGFLTLEEDTEFQYKCTNLYHSEFDSGIKWNDETINIQWPFEKYNISMNDLVISDKDHKLDKFFNEKEYF